MEELEETICLAEEKLRQKRTNKAKDHDEENPGHNTERNPHDSVIQLKSLKKFAQINEGCNMGLPSCNSSDFLWPHLNQKCQNYAFLDCKNTIW